MMEEKTKKRETSEPRTRTTNEGEDEEDESDEEEEEGDPSEYEKKKDHYNIYENELLPEDKTDENIKEYSQFEGLNDEWEARGWRSSGRR
jgi:hypothetical protein